MSTGTSYKNQRAELGLGPAGSLAPLTSTLDGSKWSHNVDAASIGKLGKLAVEINSITNDAADTLAKAQIKVGRLLNEARALIPGDQQFGKWREANTMITNKSTANKLMNLATQVGSGRITQELLSALPMSTLKELISSPDSVVESAIRMVVDEGEAPTREEVRRMNKQAKEDGGDGLPDELGDISGARDVTPKANTAPASTPGPKAPLAAPAVNQTYNNRAAIEKMIAMPLMDRLRHLDPKVNIEFVKVCKPLEWAFLILGLDPDPASYPNIQVIEVLEAAYTAESGAFAKDAENLANIIKRAAAMIKTEY